MQRIEEIFSKQVYLKTKTPFPVALKIMDLAREFGTPIERKNIYETDGPRKKVELSFELKKDMDKFTAARIIFNLNGEANSDGFLDIKIKGELRTNLSSDGPITRVFTDFYTSSLLTPLRKESDKFKELGNEIEKRIKAI